MGDAEFAHRRQAVQGQARARIGGRLPALWKKHFRPKQLQSLEPSASVCQSFCGLLALLSRLSFCREGHLCEPGGRCCSDDDPASSSQFRTDCIRPAVGLLPATGLATTLLGFGMFRTAARVCHTCGLGALRLRGSEKLYDASGHEPRAVTKHFA